MLMLVGDSCAHAQDSFPQKPVRWIAPVLAGGAGDLIARAMAPKLTELWGQQVIIDNRVGGGGTLGMGLAARMAPDEVIDMPPDDLTDLLTAAPLCVPRTDSAWFTFGAIAVELGADACMRYTLGPPDSEPWQTVAV